ncbi:MAG: NAD(P)H-quinone oxidoreductase [Gammaproteobacteria bacterium]|nr:NAD(P)H-quinone oxidoreductase [Gammaproteobacteria bacterium]MBT7372222.1 NAD(P)H-quinone oxidoreductase [Gammaproteobacteria bacterium]
MKAILVADDKSLVWGDFEDPVPGDNDVLIRVAATAINRADLVQRHGGYPPPAGASPILGLECAGEVVEAGSACTRYKTGDQVCALLPGGGYAEYAVVDEGSVLPIPVGLKVSEAAGIPEVFATAWLNLFMEANLQFGEKVVLHAGASGVGTAGIQLCRSFGAESFVTVGSAEKLATCLDLGAASGANRHDGPFLEKAQVFAPEGVDVVLDPVGAGYLADNIKLLRTGGRLVLIGLLGGARAEIDLAQVLMKRARIIGSTLRARPLIEKAEVMAQLEAKVWPLIEAGEIKVVVDRVFPIEEASQAHDLVASDQTIGKVIMELNH